MALRACLRTKPGLTGRFGSFGGRKSEFVRLYFLKTHRAPAADGALQKLEQRSQRLSLYVGVCNSTHPQHGSWERIRGWTCKEACLLCAACQLLALAVCHRGSGNKSSWETVFLFISERKICFRASFQLGSLQTINTTAHWYVLYQVL